MTHTAGPWRIDSLGVITGGPYFLTSVAETYAAKWAHCQATSAHRHSQEAADYCGKMYEVAKDNGNLIVAAPDLLAALRELVHMNACNYDRDTEDYRKALMQAASAIAKAEGITL